jgi:hypothetical protein
MHGSMTRRGFSVLSTVLLLGAAACGPSIDPAAKADIDGRVAALHGGKQSFPPPTQFMPPPLAPGQWVQLKTVDDKGQPGFMTYKIVGADGDAFWIEMVHETYLGKSVTKMLASLGNRMDPAAVQIRALKMRDNKGRVNEIDPAVLQMMQGLYRSSLSALIISWQGQPQEDAVVPAGSFSGCFKVRTDASWGPFRTASMTWSHPAVPISGLVKSQGIDSPTSMELVGFGLGGATSELP